jgi:hypothetical protein
MHTLRIGLISSSSLRSYCTRNAPLSLLFSHLGQDHEEDDGEAAAVEHDPHVQVLPPGYSFKIKIFAVTDLTVFGKEVSYGASRSPCWLDQHSENHLGVLEWMIKKKKKK